MKLFEYQGKKVFAQAGIAVPESRLVVCDGADAEQVAARVNAAAVELAGGAERAVVVKAQLDMGGRGKAGLIRFAENPAAAAAAAREILAKG